jgi:hypothetical protein
VREPSRQKDDHPDYDRLAAFYACMSEIGPDLCEAHRLADNENDDELERWEAEEVEDGIQSERPLARIPHPPVSCTRVDRPELGQDLSQSGLSQESTAADTTQNSFN